MSKKLHYITKYIVISLPLLLILLSFYRGSSGSIPINIDYVLKISTSFMNFSINGVYNDVIEVLTGVSWFSLESSLLKILLSYPLYVFWVYIFDIILDLLLLIPSLFHKLMERTK